MKTILFPLLAIATTLGCGATTDRKPPSPIQTGTAPIGPGSGNCSNSSTKLRTRSIPGAAAMTTGAYFTLAQANPLTYDKHVVKTISNSCLECHSETSKKQPPILDSYDQVKRTALQSLSAMKGGTMPPPTGTNNPNATEISLFQKWITDGMYLGADPVRSNQTTEGTAYNNAIRDFLGKHCISCHKADGSQPPALTSYDHAVAAGSESLKALKAGTMPPKTGKNDAFVTLFQEWSDKSFPLVAVGVSSGNNGNGGNSGGEQPEIDPCQ